MVTFDLSAHTLDQEIQGNSLMEMVAALEKMAILDILGLETPDNIEDDLQTGKEETNKTTDLVK